MFGPCRSRAGDGCWRQAPQPCEVSVMRHRSIAVVLLLLTALLAPPGGRSGAVAAESRSAVASDVRGFVDAHSHLFSYEAFGGMLLCGKPFDPGGISRALADCPDHYPH